MSLLSAGVMVVLAILALGSADLAKVLAAASRAQTAADAAALAAAQAIAVPDDGISPQAAAETYARKNSAELRGCSCDPDGDSATVEVRADVGDLLFFGDDRTVAGRARATVERATRSAPRAPGSPGP
jgi:uncharacterized membrane protein